MSTAPLDPQDQHLLTALDETPRSFAGIAERAHLGTGAVLGGLSRLQKAGLAQSDERARWHRAEPTTPQN